MMYRNTFIRYLSNTIIQVNVLVTWESGVLMRSKRDGSEPPFGKVAAPTPLLGTQL
jgi:hypothetical protein